MTDFSVKSILSEVQRLQAESLGRRTIGITAYTYCLNVAIFESQYDEKEDGDLRNFNFYEDSMDEYAREAEYKRMMDWYNNG